MVRVCREVAASNHAASAVVRTFDGVARGYDRNQSQRLSRSAACQRSKVGVVVMVLLQWALSRLHLPPQIRLGSFVIYHVSGPSS